jgi:uncharacterized protein YndB with AHSA1/START domain
MSDVDKAGARPKVIVERTYHARVEELWDLWTTKEGFESWWGPEGFRVEVHALDARVGGVLHYDMIADAPEMIEAMKRMGRPPSSPARARFTEVSPYRRLAITTLVDFVPGVPAYENTLTAEFFPSGDRVRMVVTMEAMHDAEMTKMSTTGLTSQLRKLEKRFPVTDAS